MIKMRINSFPGVDIVRSTKSVDIRKLAVVGVILLILFVGQVEGSNNFDNYGYYNMTLLGANTATKAGGGSGNCGGCHSEVADTISVTWSGDPDTVLTYGEQIDINFTVDFQTARSNGDDTVACALFNSTVRSASETPLHPANRGWTIDTDAAGGTLGYNLVTPYTVENGALGLHYCNWTITSPSTDGTYEIMGMTRWGSSTSGKRNMSVTFTVSSGAPEFPSLNPIASILPIILPLGIYLLFRKSMLIETPYSEV